jgi:CDGSH-type Zn-finger protein
MELAFLGLSLDGRAKLRAMNCVGCGWAAVTERPDLTARGYHRFRCRACGRQFNERSDGLLNLGSLPSDIIAFVVFCRLRYRLTLRDLSEIMLSSTQARTVLCRCGASPKKPFCDGTDSKIGFQTAAQVVPVLKAQPIRCGGICWKCRDAPQRWTPLNLTVSSAASIRPTLKRQKLPDRRSNPGATCKQVAQRSA